jgi:dTDP-4-dehydrorhamnose 3,5-epimerase
MTFRDGPIEGIIWKPLTFYRDHRGWLCEFFRHDELPETYYPVMAYMSMTEPGIARGPHEHVDQSDYFCFIGPSDFNVYLWDARPKSPTFGNKEVRVAGDSAPLGLVVPPGVVHAYKNVGCGKGVVFNGANRLYKGWGKKEPVDEIRHEEAAGSLYKLD